MISVFEVVIQSFVKIACLKKQFVQPLQQLLGLHQVLA
jgi:hypothetical protein